MADHALLTRVDRLELLVIRSVALAGAVATVLGLLLPMWHEEETDDGPLTVSLVSAPFQIFGGDAGSDLGLLGVGFAGLVLVQRGCLWLFAMAWGRNGTDIVRRVGGWFAGLSAAGTIVPLLLWLAGPSSDDDFTRGPALWPMMAGVILALVLVAGELLPDMWRHDDRR